jgi:hypothetical protein
MSFVPPGDVLPDCGVDPPTSKRILGLNKQSTAVHVRMFVCHVRAALSVLGYGYGSHRDAACDV